MLRARLQLRRQLRYSFSAGSIAPMKLSYSETPSVDFDTASAAVVDHLSQRPKNRHGQFVLTSAAAIAEAIWPGNQMRPQGAGGAASRILHRMEKRGRVYWTSRDSGSSWGWALTT